jgi:flavorubredoxin
MEYFNSPETLVELKKQYRELAQQHTGEIQAINAEYERLFPELKDVRQTVDGKTYSKENNETANQFIELMNEMMPMEGIVIEIIGCFVWVTGNTKPYKENLKGLKFRWHSTKTAWYLKPDDYRKRSRKEYGMDEIRAMYGTSGQISA